MISGNALSMIRKTKFAINFFSKFFKILKKKFYTLFGSFITLKIPIIIIIEFVRCVGKHVLDYI